MRAAVCREPPDRLGRASTLTLRGDRDTQRPVRARAPSSASGSRAPSVRARGEADGLELRHAAGHQLGRALGDPGRVERPAGLRQFVGDQVAVLLVVTAVVVAIDSGRDGLRPPGPSGRRLEGAS